METNNPRPIEEVIEEHMHEDKLIVLEEDCKHPYGYKIHVMTVAIINAVTDALRRRGWLDPEEAETLKRDHELTKRNVTFWYEKLDAANKKIDALKIDNRRLDSAHRGLSELYEAQRTELATLRVRAECTITPDEAEIQAAIDARRDHFSDCEYRVKLRRLRHGPHVSMHKEASSLWTKHRRVPNLDWLDGYQQAALDLMRIQRWEKKQDKPCSCCNAEPSSIKVEMLPHETTWREVAEAVEAAGAEFAYEIGCDGWKCRVETIPCDSIDEALERLRDMAETETKPEPVTPDAIWENEIYGVGYEELPAWVRDAIKAEAERINAKGGE